MLPLGFLCNCLQPQTSDSLAFGNRPGSNCRSQFSENQFADGGVLWTSNSLNYPLFLKSWGFCHCSLPDLLLPFPEGIHGLSLKSSLSLSQLLWLLLCLCLASVSLPLLSLYKQMMAFSLKVVLWGFYSRLPSSAPWEGLQRSPLYSGKGMHLQGFAFGEWLSENWPSTSLQPLAPTGQQPCQRTSSPFPASPLLPFPPPLLLCALFLSWASNTCDFWRMTDGDEELDFPPTEGYIYYRAYFPSLIFNFLLWQMRTLAQGFNTLSNTCL